MWVAEQFASVHELDDGLHAVDEAFGRRVVRFAGELNASSITAVASDGNPVQLARLPTVAWVALVPRVHLIAYRIDVREQRFDRCDGLGVDQSIRELQRKNVVAVFHDGRASYQWIVGRAFQSSSMWSDVATWGLRM